MKKKLLFFSLILIFFLGAYSFFHVSGTQIKGISDITPDCKVTIRKVYLGEEEQTEYVLSPQQIKKLKTLLEETRYTRYLWKRIPLGNLELYFIDVTLNGQSALLIHCSGNSYITVMLDGEDQFGCYLKARNAFWLDTLEEILLTETIE